MSELVRSYLVVALFGIAAVGMVAFMLGLARFLRPTRPTRQKLIAYESGVDPSGSEWVQSQIRYYVFAVLFVIFDVEAAFLYPWVLVLREGSWPLFSAVMVFVALILVGFVYIWRKGGLDLRKSRPARTREAGRG